MESSGPEALYTKDHLKLMRQLRYLIDKFQTPKGNIIIDFLMEFEEEHEKLITLKR